MLHEISITTSRSEDLIEITGRVEKIVSESKVANGMVHVFVPHATAGIILNESDDPNIRTDFLDALEKAVPKRAGYLHDRIDRNAAAHIRSALVGSSIFIPIKDGRLVLGTWQTIMFCEFDGPRPSRRIVVQIIETK